MLISSALRACDSAAGHISDLQSVPPPASEAHATPEQQQVAADGPARLSEALRLPSSSRLTRSSRRDGRRHQLKLAAAAATEPLAGLSSRHQPAFTLQPWESMASTRPSSPILRLCM